MFVNWDLTKQQPKDWAWKYGNGPFEVLEILEVPKVGKLGVINPIEIEFSQGFWYTIRLNNPCEHLKEIGITTIPYFHSQWFKVL